MTTLQHEPQWRRRWREIFDDCGPPIGRRISVGHLAYMLNVLAARIEDLEREVAALRSVARSVAETEPLAGEAVGREE